MLSILPSANLKISRRIFEMINFKIYKATTASNNKNTFYPTEVNVTSADIMKSVVRFDHVGAKFKDSIRKNENFIESNVIIMDCDNDHSENPDDWITPDKLHEKIPDVSFIAVSSKSNMKPKGNFSARPRHHYYFPTSKLIADSTEYSNLKRKLQAKFPFFDKNALDSARFIFGVENPVLETFDRITTIDELLNDPQSSIYSADTENDCEDILLSFEKERSLIREGNRNNTLFHESLCAFKRFGDSPKAYELIYATTEKISPHLDEYEITNTINSALKKYNKIAQQKDYVPPDKYNKLKEKNTNLKPSDFSDIGQAKIFVQENKEKLLFTYATGYMFFNGSYWEDGKIHSQRLVHELTERQLSEVKLLIKKLEEQSQLHPNKKEDFSLYLTLAHQHEKFIISCRNSNRIKATLNESIPDLAINVSDFDSNPYLLNMPSGTYNLKTSELQPHSPTDYITKQTAVDISDVGFDIWITCLQTIFQNDTELINYFQEILGLILIGEVKVESLIICQGDGSNGKTTLWNVISRVLGDYCGTISADTLTANCKRNIKPELAELQGKRLVVAPKLEEGVRLSTSTLKQICSRDKITAEKKFKDPFAFKPSHQIVLYTNPLPNVGSIDEGTWRRIILIPFNARFSGDNEIKNYEEYLFNNAGGAILKWMVEGSKKCIDNDFKLHSPAAVTNAINNYRYETDWLAQFIEDCCDVDTNASVSSSELFRTYTAYCLSIHEFTHRQKDFNAALKLKGFIKKKTNKCNVYLGIKLKSDNTF